MIQPQPIGLDVGELKASRAEVGAVGLDLLNVDRGRILHRRIDIIEGKIFQLLSADNAHGLWCVFDAQRQLAGGILIVDQVTTLPLTGDLQAFNCFSRLRKLRSGWRSNSRGT
ncbi:MAG: Uncharacterised protein [Pseudidiomarina mangrovi]|nr:MAG: Uncharacterised protein [Pseudidiomarina mangrovi]